MTKIDYVGSHPSFWAEEAGSEDPIAILRHMLSNYTLDSTFARLEGGTYRFRTRDGSGSGPMLFFGNFHDASCAFRLESEEDELIVELCGLIDQNMSSSNYDEARKSYLRYCNCAPTKNG